jgi:NarL family two-component system response regulator LiaR
LHPEKQPDYEVVGEAQDGGEAVARVAELHPDVVLMDVAMPGMDGIEAIRSIKAQQPKARILVLTTFAGEDKVFPAVRAGALGYHLKDATPEELVRAIRQVYRREPSLHPDIALKVHENNTLFVQRLLYKTECSITLPAW